MNQGGPKRLDLVGQRFGMLLVVSKAKMDIKATMFNCVCDCGKTKVLRGSELKRGKNKSCGCNRTPRTTYEYRNHPLYDVWKGMKARCRDKKHKGYSIYGGAGVIVCAEWKHDFIPFYNWSIANDWRDGLQLDKDIIAKKLGLKPNLYSPERCQFVTPAVNSQNRSTNKLTPEIVKEIRNSKSRRIDISRTYGVNVSTVDRIKSNKTWKNQ